MNPKVWKKIGIAALCSVLLFSFAGMSFAATDTDDTGTDKPQQQGKAGFFRGAGPGGMHVRGMNGGLPEQMLDKLVEEGLITQDKADAITAYLKEKTDELKAQMEELRNMTQEERKAYMESKKETAPTERQDFLAQLVEKGLLTQAEADAVKAYLQENAKTFRPEGFKGGFSEKLQTLIDEGTLTQEQADRVSEVLFGRSQKK